MRKILIMFLLMPLPASAFTAINGMKVHQLSPTEIGVDLDVRRSGTQYWCAAGDFAKRALGLSGKTRMWSATPTPRRAGQGMIFTLDPAKKAEGSGPTQFGSGPKDGSVSVGMAAGNYCRNEYLLHQR